MTEDLTYEQMHQIEVDRLLGKIRGPWSDAEARWHARQFIAKNGEDNLVRQLAEAYLRLEWRLEEHRGIHP